MAISEAIYGGKFHRPSVTTSVKIREDTKRRLERLQADLASLFGQDLTFQELLDAVAKVSEADPARVAAVNSRVKLPLSAAARRRVLSRAWDWGVEDTERDIDEVLYSDEAIHGGQKGPSRGKR